MYNTHWPPLSRGFGILGRVLQGLIICKTLEALILQCVTMYRSASAIFGVCRALFEALTLMTGFSSPAVFRTTPGCVEELTWLTRVPRFSVAVMFLSKTDRTSKKHSLVTLGAHAQQYLLCVCYGEKKPICKLVIAHREPFSRTFMTNETQELLEAQPVSLQTLATYRCSRHKMST